MRSNLTRTPPRVLTYTKKETAGVLIVNYLLYWKNPGRKGEFKHACVPCSSIIEAQAYGRRMRRVYPRDYGEFLYARPASRVLPKLGEVLQLSAREDRLEYWREDEVGPCPYDYFPVERGVDARLELDASDDLGRFPSDIVIVEGRLCTAEVSGALTRFIREHGTLKAQVLDPNSRKPLRSLVL